MLLPRRSIKWTLKFYKKYFTMQHIYSTLQHIYSTCTVLFCKCAVAAHVLLCTVNVPLLHIYCCSTCAIMCCCRICSGIWRNGRNFLGLDLGLALRRRLCCFLCLFIYSFCSLAGIKSKRRCLLDLL